jgi:hypothetical protein
VRVKHEAIPQWAEGLYYNKGLFSEVLVYYDDESLYLEVRGKESGIVRFSHEMLRTLGEIIEEEEQEEEEQEEGQPDSPDSERA